MATVEMSREFPVERKELWDRLTDPENLPAFYNNVIDASSGRFTEVGDTIEMTYRLLGRNSAGTVTLIEVEPGERIRFRGEVPGVPPVEHEWVYRDTDDGTQVDVRMESVEVDSWLGRSLDRFLIPRQLEKDLERSLDNIEVLFDADL